MRAILNENTTWRCEITDLADWCRMSSWLMELSGRMNPLQQIKRVLWCKSSNFLQVCSSCRKRWISRKIRWHNLLRSQIAIKDPHTDHRVRRSLNLNKKAIYCGMSLSGMSCELESCSERSYELESRSEMTWEPHIAAYQVQNKKSLSGWIHWRIWCYF